MDSLPDGFQVQVKLWVSIFKRLTARVSALENLKKDLRVFLHEQKRRSMILNGQHTSI
jgi:hypothetical protein